MFPNKKGWLQKPDGWEDLGKISVEYIGEGRERYQCHVLCKDVAHIGKEGGHLFKFCPRCLIKIT